MTGGAAEFYINTERYSAKKGDVLIIPPYALHRVYTVGNEACSYNCICFDSGLLCDESLKSSLESQAFSVISLIECYSHHSNMIQEYIEKATIACENKESGWELESVGNISLLFAILKKNSFISPNHNSVNDTALGQKVMLYIMKNLSTPITSRDAARELHMNQSYFCRLFKNAFGYTFEKYVLIYRLEKARLLLTTTVLPVTEIAFNLGFCSCSYFSKAFKERFNMTPTSYRKGAVNTGGNAPV